MTVAITGQEILEKLKDALPDAVVTADEAAVVVKAESLLDVGEYLKNSPGLELNYLNYISAVDYYDHFELVYQLTSLEHNHNLVIKTRCYNRGNASVPSVVGLWRGADYQEREIFDLFGVRFEGHPNLKRIVLWEGFAGHPLCKDYL